MRIRINNMVTAFSQQQQQLLRKVMKRRPIERRPSDVLAVARACEGVKFFSALEASSRLELCSEMHLQEVPPNTALFHHGDIGENYYIIVSGRVSVCVPAPTATSGDYVGGEQGGSASRSKGKDAAPGRVLDGKPQLDRSKAGGASTAQDPSPNTTSALALVPSPPANSAAAEFIDADPPVVLQAVGTLESGVGFGEVALMEGTRRAATVVTLEDTELLGWIH
eukprot:GHVT01011789.1.p1 GENE.GHVT01011789.1~~GHVT01011789.1.p1  ORF type:complete len:223 (+),score=42.22 GHVT01011789.1:952-1620(+)